MHKLFFLSAVFVTSATACGGGGGGSTPAPMPTPVVQPFTSGGTIPATGVATPVGTTGYAVLITLAAITGGTPASGSVFYSINNVFAGPGIVNAPPNAPLLPTGLGTALLYTDVVVTASSASAVAFSAQPTFRFYFPAPNTGVPYKLYAYDAASQTYLLIASQAAGGTNVILTQRSAVPTSLTVNTDYTYVFAD